MDCCSMFRKRNSILNIRGKEKQWRIADLDRFVICFIRNMRQLPSDRFYLLYYFYFLIGNTVLH
jgi:hypothetical protein